MPEDQDVTVSPDDLTRNPGSVFTEAVESIRRQVPRTAEDAVQGIVAAGGWCAPSETLPDSHALYQSNLDRAITMPEVSVDRGGFRWDHSPAAIAANEALRSQVHRAAIQFTKQREEVISHAVAIAYANGWDVHLFPHHETNWTPARDPNTYRIRARLGIEFRPAAYGIPTIVEHDPYDATYDWDED